MAAYPTWHDRFRVPTLLDIRVAAQAPERGLVLCADAGSPQLFAWGLADESLRKLTDHTSGVSKYLLSPDGRYVYFHIDDEGNEVGTIMKMRFDGGEAVAVTTDLPPFALESMTMSRSGKLIGMTVATDDGLSVHVASLDAEGQLVDRRIVYRTDAYCSGPVLSPDGQIAVVMTTEPTGTLAFGLIAFDTCTGGRIAELNPRQDGSLLAVQFCPVGDEDRLLIVSTESGVERLSLWEPRCGKRTDLKLERLSDTPVIPFGWSPDGVDILLFTIRDAVQQLFILHVPKQELRSIAHPSGTYATCDMTSTGEVVCLWSDSATPGCVVVLDRDSAAFSRIALRLGGATAERSWRSVMIRNAEGCDIQGWIVTPEGGGPFPTIIELHGGPDEVASDTYVPQAQVWVEHGYAYLTINYRGSATFGRDFEQCIWGRPGDLELQDLAAAREWLVSTGIGDATKLFVHGWSYGGYLALLALGRQPELWSGGMAGNAIIDWTVQYEEAAEDSRAYQAAFFGGGPETLAERYRASSPIAYAAAIIAPVLIFHARNDARCPAGPVRALASAIEQRNGNVTVHWLEGGHLTFTPEDLIIQQQMMLTFCSEVMDARSHIDVAPANGQSHARSKS